MASYKKYAEDLIGNWENGQYVPQREVTQNVYQTNIDKLANDFSALKDKLARNFNNAQMEYASTLNDVQNSSFNRMRNADIDLANRGLATSGVGNLVNQADIQQKGIDVDKALSGLLEANRTGVENLSQGVNALGQGQTKLASNLAGDLGEITSKEAANAQQYANLVAGIGENAAQRAAARAASGGGSSRKSAEEEQEDETKRRLLIADTIASKDFTDEEKSQYLYQYLGVPYDTAKEVITAYNNNNKLESAQKQLQTYEKNRAKIQKAGDIISKGIKYTPPNFPGVPLVTPARRLLGNILNPATAIDYWGERLTGNRLRNQVNDLTYTDIYDLLYGGK